MGALTMKLGLIFMDCKGKILVSLLLSFEFVFDEAIADVKTIQSVSFSFPLMCVLMWKLKSSGPYSLL